MFDDLLRETAFNYNLRKCKKTKKFFKEVKKGLLKSAKGLSHDKKIASFSIDAHLSENGYIKLKKLCDKNGINFATKYVDCFLNTYEFSIVVRQ